MTNARTYRIEIREALTASEISAIYRHFKGNKEEVCWLFSHNTRLLDPQLFDYEIRQYLQGHEGPLYKIKMMWAQIKDCNIVETVEDKKDPQRFNGPRNPAKAPLDIATITQIYNTFKNVSAAFQTLYGHMDEQVGRIVFYKAMSGEIIQEYKVLKIKQAFKRHNDSQKGS